MTSDSSVSRRTVLAVGAAGVAVGGTALAGCSGSTAAPAGASAGPATGDGTTSTGGSTTAGGATLASVADIPLGQSVRVAGPGGKPVILTRTSATAVAGFSAICTHRGCTVNPAGGKLNCPCHGSVYDAATGAVLQGPAPDPLPKVAVRVAGGKVVAG